MTKTIRDQVYVAQWLQVPVEARQKLAVQFNLGKSGFSNVVNNVVVSDGHTDLDLSDLTVDKLQDYIVSGFTNKTSIIGLLEMAVTKILTPEPIKIVTPEVAILPKEEAKQARKAYEKRKKQADKLGKMAKKTLDVRFVKGVKKLGKKKK